MNNEALTSAANAGVRAFSLIKIPYREVYI